MAYIEERIGTSEEFGTVQITGNVNADLLAAVSLEHPCSDRCCDIAEAMNQDFEYVAAYLLHGATETPLLDAVIAYYNVDFSGDKFPQWADWVTYHTEHSRECAACGGYQFGGAETCGNCGGRLVGVGSTVSMIGDGGADVEDTVNDGRYSEHVTPSGTIGTVIAVESDGMLRVAFPDGNVLGLLGGEYETVETNAEARPVMRIATYYNGASEPAEIIEVDADIAAEYIASTAKMIKRDNKRHKLTDRIAEIDGDGALVRWLS